MAALQHEIDTLKKERDQLHEECVQLHVIHDAALNQIELLKEQLASNPSEPTPTTELPDAFTLLQRLRAKHPLFNGEKPKCKIKDKDAEIILELLELQ